MYIPNLRELIESIYLHIVQVETSGKVLTNPTTFVE